MAGELEIKAKMTVHQKNMFGEKATSISVNNEGLNPERLNHHSIQEVSCRL